MLLDLKNRQITDWDYILPSKWTDGEWRLVTPAINGRAFFENVCTGIDSSELKAKASLLVKKIFSGLDDDCRLLDKSPFASLRSYCVAYKKEDLLAEVAALEKLIGPLLDCEFAAG